jgi:hypothetical protein
VEFADNRFVLPQKPTGVLSEIVRRRSFVGEIVVDEEFGKVLQGVLFRKTGPENVEPRILKEEQTIISRQYFAGAVCWNAVSAS